MPKAAALVGNGLSPSQSFDVLKYLNIRKAELDAKDREKREKLRKLFRESGFSVGVIQHKKPA